MAAPIPVRVTLSDYRRALRYVVPVRRLFVGKAVLMSLAVIPTVILPWPAKILVDHVIQGLPLDPPLYCPEVRNADVRLQEAEESRFQAEDEAPASDAAPVQDTSQPPSQDERVDAAPAVSDDALGGASEDSRNGAAAATATSESRSSSGQQGGKRAQPRPSHGCRRRVVGRLRGGQTTTAIGCDGGASRAFASAQSRQQAASAPHQLCAVSEVAETPPAHAHRRHRGRTRRLEWVDRDTTYARGGCEKAIPAAAPDCSPAACRGRRFS